MRGSPENRPQQPFRERKIKIPVNTLDISQGWDTAAQADIIFKALSKKGINPQECAYAGISGDDIELVVSTGRHSADSNEIFCSDTTDMQKGYGHTDPTALDIALAHQNPALVVYDSNFLEFQGSDNYRKYIVKTGATPEQLIRIIYKLKL